ncbi:MAG: recombinase family protein [Cytophagales bacterium]|nr:recombinase family protein [Cytophagales bacterium]
MKKRVAIYLRVSTPRQAKQDISIPDQRNQARSHCNAKGWDIVREFIEPGKSATDDRRPIFQKMISEACSNNHPFDVILVYSYSRFFRDAVDSGVYRRKLEKYNVSVDSITQDFGDGHDGELLKQIIAAVDEHASKENGKNVLSRMIENAKQGFWNGAVPPFGFKTIVAEVRGDTKKKKLAINPKEADVVKTIYKLYLTGEADSGAMGIRAITSWLNERGYRKKNGKLFYANNVHTILTSPIYSGTYLFNTKCAKTGNLKPRSDWVTIKCPAIVDKELFEKVQNLLKQKQSNVTPTRNHSACTLLSGIAKCAKCQCNYMLMTSGKGKQYRYYKPSHKVRSGYNSCDCRNIPMQYLDDLVMDQVIDKMLNVDFIKAIIKELSEAQKNHCPSIQTDLQLLRKEMRETEKRLNNLYETLAEGKVKDFETFNEFIDKENLRFQDLRQQIKIKQQQQSRVYNFSNTQIDRFTRKFKDSLRNGPVEFKKQRLQEIVSEIEIEQDKILIKASKPVLAEIMLNMKKGENSEVRISERKWWAIPDTDTQIILQIDLSRKY